ncbi:hypothetical protein [Tsukamurella pseudospumae]|uniref:Uncharacterized protein n=1 Tax=Tsukamurella pseudospumae TaxID=239498 RepID=A0A137Z811_9ACTN|nr:hypothetical protein [Tsukamurella pseudospumae]KXO94308.1 hypothetical protein AXK61_23825 [Tsukamurella pseudospumae]
MDTASSDAQGPDRELLGPPFVVPVPLGTADGVIAGAGPSTAEQEHVSGVLASILGSLRGSEHLPDSGLHWAVGLLSGASGATIVAATSDAGWLPPPSRIPEGVRVLWNVPEVAWALLDDPVRQVVEYARANDYELGAVATTHPGRSLRDAVGAGGIVGLTAPGSALDGARPRFDVVASPERAAQIRAMDTERAARQIRALLRDLERIPDGARDVVTGQAPVEARRYLGAERSVPESVIDQLSRDRSALDDAMRAERVPARTVGLGEREPTAIRLYELLLDRARVDATFTAIAGDIEGTVYHWTFAKRLAAALTA